MNISYIHFFHGFTMQYQLEGTVSMVLSEASPSFNAWPITSVQAINSTLFHLCCRLTALLILHLKYLAWTSVLLRVLIWTTTDTSVNTLTSVWTWRSVLQVCPHILIHKQILMFFQVLKMHNLIISVCVGLTYNNSARVSIVKNKYNLDFLQHPNFIKPAMTFSSLVNTVTLHLCLFCELCDILTFSPVCFSGMILITFIHF